MLILLKQSSEINYSGIERLYMETNKTVENRLKYWMEYFENRDRQIYKLVAQDACLNTDKFDPEFGLYSMYVNMPQEYFDLWTDIDKKLFVQLTKDIAYSNNWSDATYDIIDKQIQRSIDKDEIFGLTSWAYFITSGDWLPASWLNIPEGINRESLNIDFDQ